MQIRKPRRSMTPLAFARRQIQQLGPYQSLALILLPILLVEPLKVAAVFVAGEGHWLAGTGILVAAYATSLVFVERLFKVVKPKLMTMNWFASIWIWFTAVRDKAWVWFRGVRKRLPAICASER
jgi:hypothetical protein